MNLYFIVYIAFTKKPDDKYAIFLSNKPDKSENIIRGGNPKKLNSACFST